MKKLNSLSSNELDKLVSLTFKTSLSNNVLSDYDILSEYDIL